MKWIYGKQDWKSMKRGQENCYLLTNGLGGFSSMTMTGSASRNDHSVLMGCIQAPNHRYNMIHRLSEKIITEEETSYLSSQEFADGSEEKGYEKLNTFWFEDNPVWLYQVNAVAVKKELAIEQEKNTVALTYQVENLGKADCTLEVMPFLQFTPKGSQPKENQHYTYKDGEISSNGLTLKVRTNGEICEVPEVTQNYYYAYDACDGRRETGIAKGNHKICMNVQTGETKTLDLVYTMGDSAETAAQIIEDARMYRQKLEQQSGFLSQTARMLAKSAHQFISHRASTGKKTILAGFPFFEDWGRDTMIALPGICISTGQYHTAKEILRTFAANEKDGLMPNLFPEGKSEPLYNTADAALLFINCVYLYDRAVSDPKFVREMYPVMKGIMEGYEKGTHYNIHMDEDGLILAGEGLSQVTWMDVRIGEFLPTPRHGKPVEINAYWYNALCIMDYFTERLFPKVKNSVYRLMAEKVKHSFREKFWMSKKGCLKDLVSGTPADLQIRCNQIWAVSLPFTMLEPEQEKQVVQTVYEKLYTPYGLRTLESGDKEFHPYYGGPMEQRDRAYHQGTVWVFPLGAYYLSYLKIHNNTRKAKEKVKEQLLVLESAMREGCIGQLPEIYDGINPTSSKGCFAQAWSVGELLRVYEKIEKE